MPKTLDAYYSSRFYAWNSHAILVVCPSASFDPAAYVGLQTFTVAHDDSSAEGVVDAPTGDDLTGRNVPACSFAPRTKRREEVWLISFKVY